MAKCKRCKRAETHQFSHGASGYANHACRCAVCMVAHRGRMRKYRDENSDKIQKYDRTRNGLRREERNARQRERNADYYEANRAQVLDSSRNYYAQTKGYSQRVRSERRKFSEATLSQARRYERWSDDERQTAQRTDITVLEIANLLGRSQASVGKQRSIARRVPDVTKA